MTLFYRLGISGRRRLITAALSLGAWLLLAAGASQAGTIKTVLVTPSSPKVKQVVTISVKGVGICGEMRISYGDGNPDKTLSGVDFANGKTLAETHHYDDPGPKTIKVWGTKKCSGNKNVTVNVQPGLTVQRGGQRPMGRKPGEIGVEKTPKPLMQLKPVITGAIASPTIVPAPGATMHFKGKHFGKKPGKIRMYGSFPGSPIELWNVNWKSDTQVNGRIGVSAGKICVKDVSFEIVTATNAKSDKYTQGWKEETRELASSDSAVKLLTCDKDANVNKCNGKTFWGDDCELGPPKVFTVSPSSSVIAISGYHSNCSLAVGDDSGVDTYAVDLSNGWYIDTTKFTSNTLGPGQEVSQYNTAAPHGKSSWVPSFKWMVTPGDGVNYDLWIKIRGPVGCKHYIGLGD